MPDSPPNPLLLRNLQRLGVLDPRLAERALWAYSNDHIQQRPDGLYMLRHRTMQPLGLGDDQTAEVIDQVAENEDREVLLLGIGDGMLLARLLNDRPETRVAAWTQDPALLANALSAIDWRPFLESGRLRFLLTTDLLDIAPADVVPIRHPVVADIHRHGAALFDAPKNQPRALLVQGALFVDDIADALREEGWVPIPWDVTGWSREELARARRHSDARVAFAVNYTHGLAEACAGLKLPLRVWEIDPSTDSLHRLPGGSEGAASRGARIYTWRRAQEPRYRDAGFAQVEFLPLAANPQRRRPLPMDDPETYGGDVVFVGSSMVAAAERLQLRLVAAWTAWRGGDAERAQTECLAVTHDVLNAQRQSLHTYRVPELLSERAPEFVAAARAPDLLRILGAPPHVHVGEMAAADKRFLTMANLTGVDTRVWGDEGWRGIQEHGIRWMGPAGHRDELTRIYSSSAMHIDIGRIYQSDIVTMRVFDVLACGGFCLAEYSDGIEDLFELGVELDVWRTLEELLEKASFWHEAGPERRREVGLAGRERVLRDHTIRLRLKQMLTD